MNFAKISSPIKRNLHKSKCWWKNFFHALSELIVHFSQFWHHYRIFSCCERKKITCNNNDDDDSHKNYNNNTDDNDVKSNYENGKFLMRRITSHFTLSLTWNLSTTSKVIGLYTSDKEEENWVRGFRSSRHREDWLSMQKRIVLTVI